MVNGPCKPARKQHETLFRPVFFCAHIPYEHALNPLLLNSRQLTSSPSIPDRTTPTGQIINTYLTSSTAASLPDQAIHLLFTANRWEAVPLITSLLSQGVTIVCDRYYYSGMVYSAAKQNPDLPLSWARAPEVGLPRPDVVLFLDLSPDKAKERGGWGEERYEKAEMQERVRTLFWGLKDQEGGGQEKEDLVVVDAGGSVEEVAEEVWKVVREKVEESEREGRLGREVRRVL